VASDEKNFHMISNYSNRS